MSAPAAAPRIPVPAIAAPARPTGVLAAAYLLSGASAFWLAAAIATLFAIPQYSRFYGDLEQDPDAGTRAAFLLVTAAIFAALAAGPSILLAVLDALGRPAARVLTWIFGGLAVCVAGSILLLDLFVAIPWHRWLMTGTAVLTLVFVLATGVLLGLHSSGEYFRAARQARAARRAAARLTGAPSHRPSPGYLPTPYPQPYRQPFPPPSHQPFLPHGRQPMMPPPGGYPYAGRPGAYPPAGYLPPGSPQPGYTQPARTQPQPPDGHPPTRPPAGRPGGAPTGQPPQPGSGAGRRPG